VTVQDPSPVSGVASRAMALVQNNFAKMRMFCIMSLWQIPQ
jgi:hypothetical protein